MVGEVISHYRILGKLGAGGMGEVYRARDERLDRDVALKVLPAGALADETARRRFRKEALTLLQLNHPNIATVFDFDTQGGVDFLAMEFVAGETLAQKLNAGALPEKEVLALAMQIAEALQEAHERDVIHRDLKPGNVMVTAKGRVKVLDFGLAKLVKPTEVDAATASLAETQAGTVMGTVPYMAPEQLQGKVVDARTDVYALGAVLYEMATGRRPFPEKQATQLIAAILTQPPQPPRELNGQVSPGLEAIILKALEKNPDERYQSAPELLADLQPMSVAGSGHAWVGAGSARPREGRALGYETRREGKALGYESPREGKALGYETRREGRALGYETRREGRALPYRRMAAAFILGVIVVTATLVGLNIAGLRERLLGGKAGPPKIESIAVLPLENLSRDPEQEYFADGMTEELITNLAKISALKVISRTSVMHYKGTGKTVPEIAKELRVDAVVEGSVQRSGNRVRITAQLVDARSDTHLWAESYERDLRDVLALQDELAQAIASRIRVALTSAERLRLSSARAVNPEAYEDYLRGRYHWNKRSEEGLKRGLIYFQQAIEKDASYALGYAGVADSYNQLGIYGFLAPRETFPKAKAAATKALEIDDTLPEAHAALAFTKHRFDWDWPGAEREFKRAIELRPTYGTAHQWYGLYLSTVGRAQEAIAESRRAQELDPLSLIINSNVAWVYYFARQYDQAIGQFAKAVELDPNFWPAHHWLAWAYEEAGRHEEAIAEAQKAVALSRGAPYAVGALGYAYARAGKRGEAQKVLNQFTEQSEHRYVSAYYSAEIYVGLGEKDQAMRWLEKAYREPYGDLVWLKVSPRFDSLRSDRRFQDLLRRMKFPQ